MMWSVMRVKGGLLTGLRSSDTSKFLEEYIALHFKVTVYVNPCCFFFSKTSAHILSSAVPYIQGTQRSDHCTR